MLSTYTIEYTDTRVELASFEPAEGAREYHAMIHVSGARLDAKAQIDYVLSGLRQLRDSFSQPAVLLTRVYLSDKENLEPLLREACEQCHLAYDQLSVVQQPPLDGTKVALLVWLASDMRSSVQPPFSLCAHGAYTHLFATAEGRDGDSREQTATMLRSYAQALDTVSRDLCPAPATMAANCVRTWFFVHDIDRNYAGMVVGRNEVFDEQGLTAQTHYITSTGIGCTIPVRGAVHFDSYTVLGIQPQQVHYLYAADHLNRTSDYGVRFERGTALDYGDRRHVFISGTASIDAKGEILHRGDAFAQVHRMADNVEALLAEAGLTFDDVAHMVVYLRDMADYDMVSHMFAARFPSTPRLIVHAPVCRPGWLVEMECMAIKTQLLPQFPAF